MRKLVILLLIVFLVGCTNQKSADINTKEPSAASDETKQIIDSSNPLFFLLENKDAAPNAKYRYSKLPNLNTETVTMKGNKIKMDLISGIIVKDYSTIYLDSSTKEAFGICEERKDSVCSTTGKVTVLNYDDFAPLTPYYWLEKVPNVAEIKGTESMNQRQATVIEFGYEGKNIRMLIN